MIEDVVQFGPGRALVGILTRPEEADAGADLPAVVMLNAGLMHRVGPNRIYVKIARALARSGFTVLRFDFSGMGDSRPRTDHLPYLQAAPAEAGEAMNWLAEHRGIRRFVLMGHCSGAGFSYYVANQDERVVGAAIINFEGGSEEWTEYDRRRKVSREFASQYGREAMLSRERWAKVLTGRADYYSIARSVLKGVLWYRVTEVGFRVRRGFARHKPAEPNSVEAKAQADLRRLVDRGVALAFIHAEGSTGYAQVHAALGDEIARLCAEGRLSEVIVPQSDHLFTLVARQHFVVQWLTEWAQAHWCKAPIHDVPA